MMNQNSLQNFTLPEIEYQAEELRKRLLFSMANFAQVRFLRAVKRRMSGEEIQ